MTPKMLFSDIIKMIRGTYFHHTIAYTEIDDWRLLLEPPYSKAEWGKPAVEVGIAIR